MRDIDREIGLRWGRDDEREVRAREVGERLLFVDELEETVEVLRRSGVGESDQIRSMERRLERERSELLRMESRGSLDYDAVTRAMQLAQEMG